ncbi:MAG: Rad52/Rad22 family DNA repair protein [Anaerolineae bacterium]|nr:hypothetical protein [Chloroflexota bacterium]
MGEILDQEKLRKLAEPFREDQVRWKPQVVSEGGRALAVAYVDPRVVSERLDQVVGGDWSFRWESLGVQGDRLVVKSSLTVCGVTREDVGEHLLSEREQADPWKSAVSDALKRAAVHFGVGRYLYWLETVWCSYDTRRREFIDEPYIDGQGRVRVRRRQTESASASLETANVAERRPRGTARSRATAPLSGAGAARAQQQGTPAGRSVAEPASVGVTWANDLVIWAERYLEHKGLASSRAKEVIAWLIEQGEMQADLTAYGSLSDAQAELIRGLPDYVRAHTGSTS